ncbi:hypothetical protein HCN44_007099 [Aphidius gifuensis]|uniref:Uncharacterized protein n=1 Tax=Aphidius gifuensis TaxID=684658 RepID=A0A835CMT8_APHGI|nr:hypothetical protein HCN44_007099 [Aphidius gifuensis]
MKFFIKLLFLCGISLTCVYSFNNDDDCQVQQCFKICKNDKKLVSVKNKIKSLCSDTLIIFDKNISSIESSAFENLNITTLIMNTASQKLIFDQDSFTGLPILETLKLFDGVVKLKKNLFSSINTLTSLSLTINGTEQTFENGLLEFKNLSELTILKSNLSVIDNCTFLNINPTITTLVLSHNNMDSIKSNAFYSFKNLDYLQINSNNLTIIDNYSFVGLKKLDRLKISDENIVSFSDKSFDGLENLGTLEIMKNLKEIDLMNNQINKIEKDAFTGLNLTKLNLRMILLSLVFNNCEGSCYFINRKFEVCKNSTTLVSVRETNKDKISNLKHPLYIRDKNISSISSNAFKNLTIYHLILELADEKLNVTQESFNGLPNLGILEFFSGMMTIKKNMFMPVKSLHQLTLILDGKNKNFFNNKLDELLKLRILKIQKSNLGIIESDMFINFDVPIEKLELINNKIVEMRANSFDHFEKVTFLKLDNNKINKLEYGVFNGLTNLMTLSVSRNQLSNISRWEINYLLKLKNLNMAHNSIVNIEAGSFEGLNLNTLDLSYNKLHIIKSQTFRGLTIEYLDLSNNRNIYFQKDAFLGANITNLKLSQRAFMDNWKLGISANITTDD